MDYCLTAVRSLNFSGPQIDFPVMKRVIQIIAGYNPLSERTALGVGTVVLHGIESAIRCAEYS
jgi:hypothetical protein